VNDDPPASTQRPRRVHRPTQPAKYLTAILAPNRPGYGWERSGAPISLPVLHVMGVQIASEKRRNPWTSQLRMAVQESELVPGGLFAFQAAVKDLWGIGDGRPRTVTASIRRVIRSQGLARIGYRRSGIGVLVPPW